MLSGGKGLHDQDACAGCFEGFGLRWSLHEFFVPQAVYRIFETFGREPEQHANSRAKLVSRG